MYLIVSNYVYVCVWYRIIPVVMSDIIWYDQRFVLYYTCIVPGIMYWSIHRCCIAHQKTLFSLNLHLILQLTTPHGPSHVCQWQCFFDNDILLDVDEIPHDVFVPFEAYENDVYRSSGDQDES